MNLPETDVSARSQKVSNALAFCPTRGRVWFAVFTLPKNERSVQKHLALREVESFLPTYETVRCWKNRQRVHVTFPLFPSYVFVHVEKSERIKVLQCPGVLHIVGNGRNHIPVNETELALLRWGVQNRKIEPYSELALGQKVRIKSGIMEGVIGTLIRKNDSFRFVLTLQMINQHASVEVDANTLESV